MSQASRHDSPGRLRSRVARGGHLSHRDATPIGQSSPETGVVKHSGARAARTSGTQSGPGSAASGTAPVRFRAAMAHTREALGSCGTQAEHCLTPAVSGLDCSSGVAPRRSPLSPRAACGEATRQPGLPVSTSAARFAVSGSPATHPPQRGILATEAHVTRPARSRIADHRRPSRGSARAAAASLGVRVRATTRGALDAVVTGARRRASRPGGFGRSERTTAGRTPARTRTRDANERRIGAPPGPPR